MELELEATNTAMLLSEMVSTYVEDRDQVSVVMSRPDDRVVLSVSVAPHEVGRLLGKGGERARRLRAALKAASERSGVKFELNIAQAKTRRTNP